MQQPPLPSTQLPPRHATSHHKDTSHNTNTQVAAVGSSVAALPVTVWCTVSSGSSWQQCGSIASHCVVHCVASAMVSRRLRGGWYAPPSIQPACQSDGRGRLRVGNMDFRFSGRKFADLLFVACLLPQTTLQPWWSRFCLCR
jgi:hypothetical protein